VIAEGTSEQLKARLGGTVAEIGFERADSISVAAGKLAPLGNVDVQGTKLFLSVDGPTALLEAVRVLDAEHLEPTSLVVREPTLDDVFLAITGHAAEEGDERDEDARKGRR
jgi:ABC-2 type transport system ATP-binding protein